MSSSRGTVGHLDIGGVFDATGDIYKRAFGTFWIVALVLLVPAAIIQAVLGDSALAQLISNIVNWVAMAWLVGSVIRLVQDVETDGVVDMSVGELLGSIAPKLLPIIVLQILVSIIVGIGLILLIVPGVILALVLAVSMPSLVVEDRGIFDSMGRSAELTRNNRMRILGIGLLIILIVIGVSIINGILFAISPVIGAIGLIVLGILLYPYLAMITTVLFYRLREVHEGGTGAVEETLVVEEDAGPPPAV